MDLHRAAFKMENSSYLPNPLASPALMVLASTAEASRDASIPCQQPRPFGVPVSVDKDVHIPFTNGSYTFASMYHRQGGVPGAFTNRDFPPSLLHLHPQFAPPNLDCTPISMLNHSGVGAFRPFASTEDRESYQSAFTPAKRLKNCHDTDSPHLRFSDADGKEYEFGAQLPSGSPGSLKIDDTGKKIFAVSGLISDRETSSSPEDRNDRYRSDSQGGPPVSVGASQRMALTFPLCASESTAGQCEPFQGFSVYLLYWQSFICASSCASSPSPLRKLSVYPKLADWHTSSRAASACNDVLVEQSELALVFLKDVLRGQ
ncbi:E3 ubiquitin-protein ligase Rnf220-like [Erythrolamprus reginae]|uniref:E3 ubiquitin-protein ligase Rnf220-like n=1 Tax=Erythrolamprus reginae TaxID=121349 RepID=UPI00396C5966